MALRHCGVTLSSLGHSHIVTHELPRTFFSSSAEGTPGSRTCSAIEADLEVRDIFTGLGGGETPGNLQSLPFHHLA